MPIQFTLPSKIPGLGLKVASITETEYENQHQKFRKATKVINIEIDIRDRRRFLLLTLSKFKEANKLLFPLKS